MFKANAKIFIAYEDAGSFAAISQVAVVSENMPQIPHHEEMDAVNFSEFWAEQTWDTAVQAVAGVETIIFSLSGLMDLPVPVRRWVETWPKFERIHHASLVVVFQNEPVDGSKQKALISYFQQIAENHGLDFAWHCCGAKHFPVHPQSAEPVNKMEMPMVEQYQAPNLLALPKAA